MPHKQFSVILVVDREATCWEPKAQPDDQENEIIEIGCDLKQLMDLARLLESH